MLVLHMYHYPPVIDASEFDAEPVQSIRPHHPNIQAGNVDWQADHLPVRAAMIPDIVRALNLSVVERTVPAMRNEKQKI